MELFVNVTKVEADGVDTDLVLSGDLFVKKTVYQTFENFLFSFCEFPLLLLGGIGAALLCEMLEHFTSDRAGDW